MNNITGITDSSEYLRLVRKGARKANDNNRRYALVMREGSRELSVQPAYKGMHDTVLEYFNPLAGKKKTNFDWDSVQQEEGDFLTRRFGDLSFSSARLQ